MARGIRLLALPMLAAAAVAAAEACSSDGFSSTVDDDAGKAVERGDAQASSEDAAASLATLRLAHLARELGAVDFCYQEARAGSFEGPVLEGKGADPDAGDGAARDADADAEASIPVIVDGGLDADAAGSAEAGARGLAYGSVTKYFTLEASGTIKIAIVRAGATSCNAPLAEGTVTLDPGKLSSVVLFGARSDEDGGAASIGAFVDTRETKDDRARVRFIHAASSGPLAVRASGATMTVLTDRIDPRKASSASQQIPVDALGFATVPPIAPPTSLVVTALAADAGAAAEPWQTAAMDLDLRGGSLHTGFVLDADEILWCADKSTSAELTACTLLR